MASASAPLAWTQRTDSVAVEEASSSVGREGRQMRVSWATCSAVSGASPVSIETLCADSVSAWMTVGESARVLHAKAMKPSKVRPNSAHSRGRLAA